MRTFRLLALAACLAALFPGGQRLFAQGADAETLAAEALLAQAAQASPKVLSARASLEKARIAYEATLPVKGASLSAKASASSELDAPDSGVSLSGDLGVSLPILPNLSVGASLSVKEPAQPEATAADWLSASASLNWSPLASNENANKAKLAYELAQAALVQALRDASQEASAQIVNYLGAREALSSAKESQAIAAMKLMAAKAKSGMGQISASELVKAEKDAASADRAVAKAENSLAKAKASLASAVGGELGMRVAGGAEIQAADLASVEGWEPPAFATLPKTKAVLEAEANLAGEKRTSVFNQGNGPLSLSAGINSKLALSASLNFSLSLSQIDGSAAKSKKIAIEAAQRALDEALSQAETSYSDAVYAAQDALLALKDAEYQLEAESQNARAAELMQASGSISESEYRAAVKAEKEAIASLASARMNLAKARAWFSSE